MDDETATKTLVRRIVSRRVQDIQISSDEGKRLPLNFLMVKAMHDRELLASSSSSSSSRAAKRTAHDGNPRDGRGRNLSPRDRRILRRSAHYARFAAASYDSFVDTVKELAADEDALPPPDLLSKRYSTEEDGEERVVSLGNNKDVAGCRE